MQIEKDSETSATPKEFSFTADQKLYISSRLPKGFTISPVIKALKEHRDHPVKNKSIKSARYDDDQSSVSKAPKELDKTSSTMRKPKIKQPIQSKKPE